MFPPKRPDRRTGILVVLLALGVQPLCGAQPAPTEAEAARETATLRDDTLRDFLSQHGQREVLAAHLREAVAHAAVAERPGLAEALARLYVQMLADNPAPERRAQIETASRELLDLVPEADSFALRIDLAKASYLPAEETAERVRLRLADDSERTQAAGVMRARREEFQQLSARLNTRVLQLESREKSLGAEEGGSLLADLAESRRLRSLSAYYEGWSSYYLAHLTGTREPAHEALMAFGVVLNAVPGKPASVERCPKNLLRYEHVGRAAIGCALSSVLAGDDVEAVRWLEQLELADELPASVEEQLFSRTLVVLASADRWADAQALVTRRRRELAASGKPAFTIAEARLLAVLALEAARREQLRDALRTAASDLAQVGLAELVARGEVGQVVDLVQKYGTLPVGQTGFIVAYVRALKVFEQTRTAHKAAASKPDEPATDAPSINGYRQAAELFASALAAGDAHAFDSELAQGWLRLGLAHFYAGDLEPAALAFEKSFELAPQKPDALWYAIVALDLAVQQGLKSQVQRRDRLAALYIQSFPASENATRLLLRQAGAQGLSDEQTLEILLKLPPNSPLYTAARRQAARLLFTGFRSAPPERRSFAALRFAQVAEDLMKRESSVALSAPGEAGRVAANEVILRARQLADVLLSLSTPDLPRVEGAIELLREAALRQGVDIRPLEDEITFRKLQIALFRGDDVQVQPLLDRLRSMSGPYSVAADRLLLKRADEAWRQDPENPDLAAAVVRFGENVLKAAGAADASSASVRDLTARAAAAVFRLSEDTAMRDLAIKLDREQIEAGRPTVSSLRRLAELLETAGNNGEAFDAWNDLLAGFEPGSSDWLEARYHTLRLLLAIDVPSAVAVYDQYVLLHPTRAPEPWGSKLEELGRRIEAARPPAVPAPAPGSPPTGGAP